VTGVPSPPVPDLGADAVAPWPSHIYVDIMVPMKVGALLRRARLEAGLSQRELARRAGTSQPTLARYERDRAVPTLATLERLLAATGKRLQLAIEDAQVATGGPIAHVLTVKRDEVQEILDGYGVTSARVFGSVARGEDAAGSDLDLLVDLPRATYVTLAALRADLEDALGVPVDVTVAPLLTPSARRQAETEAVPL
jgi:uncharacterized protein